MTSRHMLRVYVNKENFKFNMTKIKYGTIFEKNYLEIFPKINNNYNEKL